MGAVVSSDIEVEVEVAVVSDAVGASVSCSFRLFSSFNRNSESLSASLVLLPRRKSTAGLSAAIANGCASLFAVASKAQSNAQTNDDETFEFIVVLVASRIENGMFVIIAPFEK